MTRTRLLRDRKWRFQRGNTGARLVVSKLLLWLGILLLISSLPLMFSIGPFVALAGLAMLVASVILVRRR